MTLYHIDANSQFTYVPKAPANPFEVPEDEDDNLADLINGGAFTYGHFVFGDNHNAFAVHPNLLEEDQLRDIADDIQKKLADFHKVHRRRPDLLLYPTESSAEYFVEKRRSVFGAPHEARLTPAFREFGRRELRIEPRIRTMGFERKKSRDFMVVFFDDSISSGVTEKNAMAAVWAEINSVFEATAKVHLYWFTYTIVRRSSSSTDNASTYVLGEGRRITPVAAAYCDVPHESVGKQSCLMCEAALRLHTALHWSSDMFPSAQKVLQVAYDIARPHQSDLGGTVRPVLRPETLCALLALHRHQVYDVCPILEGAASFDADRLAAAAYYCALNYHDVRAYLTEAKLREIWLALLESPVLLKLDEGTIGDGVLQFLALLPTSMLRSLAADVRAWKAFDNLSLAHGLAVSALIVGNEFRVFASRAHVIGPARSLGDARRQQIVTLAEFGSLVEKARNGADAPALTPHLVALSAPYEKGPAELARALAVRLFRGAHDSYIYNEISLASLESARDVMASVFQVMELEQRLMLKLGLSLADEVDDEKRNLDRLLDAVLEAGDEKDELEELKFGCEAAIDRFWREEGSLEGYLATGHALEAAIRGAADRAFISTPFAVSGVGSVAPQLVEFGLKLPAELTLLVLNDLEMEDLFKNLIENAFFHFDEASESVGREQRADYLATIRTELPRGGPLLRVDAHLDRARHFLYLRFTDRARLANADELYLHRTSLANSKHQLELIGGDLEWMTVAEAVERFGEDGLIPSWQNCFVVRLPVILYDALHPPLRIFLME